MSGLPLESPETITSKFPGTPGQSIGIWKQKIENYELVYERDLDRIDEWPNWSDTQKLLSRKQHKRIVLLGESVARGYLYDPYYNVAMELEAIINGLFKSPWCEVVDLAKNSITMQELLHLARESNDLDPDAVLIFAGNNWLHALRDSLGSEDYKKMFDLFRQDSFAGVSQYLEKKFETIIQSFLGSMRDIFVKRQVPVVFLVPGFNLKDWKSDTAGKNLAWLPGNAVAEWLEAKTAAEHASLNKQFEQLEKAAEKMVRLDPFNPLGYELLSEAYMAGNKRELALECLEACRDSVLISRGGNEHPRCFGIIAKSIRAAAESFGITAIDLHSRLKGSMMDGIPDRSLFLDYCHLTVKGIKISMRHAAAALMQLLTGEEISVEQVAASNLYPSKEALSAAHFCAAIHNAHSGQPRPILDYHCRQSLAFSENIAGSMLQYVDFANRYASTSLCKSFRDMMAAGKLRQYTAGFGLGSFNRGKLLDLDLVDSIADTMKAAGISHIAELVTQMRSAEHGIRDEKVNLLESYYSTVSLRDLVIDPRPAYFQARSDHSSFSFIADAEASLGFELVYRTPGRCREGATIDISLNGLNNIVKRLTMSSKWQTANFDVDATSLKQGVNKIFIRWPYTNEPLNESFPVVSAGAFFSATLPILGEIHCLTVTANRNRHDKCSPGCPRRSDCAQKLKHV